MPKKTVEFVQWATAVDTMFGMDAGGGKTAPSMIIHGSSSPDWEEELGRADKADRTHCYSLIVFVGEYPSKIQHLFRCGVCGKYERPWARPKRCSCWVKYDPETREMGFFEKSTQ